MIMKKVILLFLFTFIGMSVSCEKSDWLSPEDVDNIKNQYTTQINELTFDNNTLTTQASELTTQVATLTEEVSTLTSSVSTLTESNTTLTSSNTTLTDTNTAQLATIEGLNTSVTDLTTQVASLTTNIETLDAQIVTLTTSNTALTASSTTTAAEIATLTASVTSLQTEITTLETQADALADEILTFKNFKSIRDKIDVLVAATIGDANLNTAVDNISAGLTSTSTSSTVLRGLIAAEADWVFDNAIKSGTVSMTTAVSSFYDTSTDTNVVNFRTLVAELTTAWNAAKEPQLLLWFIEFINEYENL
jgi:SMC interacting uncharacterized protein involved in chromosome segregation